MSSDPGRGQSAKTGEPGKANGASASVDSRLRALEVGMARLEERVDAIKESMATKTDISNLKVWILTGVVLAIPVSVAIATLLVRVLFPNSPS